MDWLGRIGADANAPPPSYRVPLRWEERPSKTVAVGQLEENAGTGRGSTTVESLYPRWYITFMVCEVEFTDEFKGWYEDTLSVSEQRSIARVVEMLEEMGPALAHPHSSGIKGSRFTHMRELRIQHEGHPYRVLYAFDPRRAALLLLGGDKTGDDRWYEKMIPKADKLYADHLRAIRSSK